MTAGPAMATVGQLMEPTWEPPERATLAHVHEQLLKDEALFIRSGTSGWAAIIARLTVGQPVSRRLIDLPAVPVEALSPGTDTIQALSILERSPLPCSPVVDGGRLVGRLSHQRLRDALRDAGQDDLLAELTLTREVTAAVAHDLGNLLMVASAASEMLTRRAQGDARAALTESLGHATELVERLRAVHRTPRVAAVRVSLKDALTRIEPVLSALVRGVALLELETEPAVAWCPPTLVDRACVNLVVNARDALEECGGTIRISTGRDDGQAWLAVADDGPGIPPHALARLFERGFSTKIGEHRGLGLHTLRRLIERAGGTLVVESAPSEGTTFTVRLPELPR